MPDEAHVSSAAQARYPTSQALHSFGQPVCVFMLVLGFGLWMERVGARTHDSFGVANEQAVLTMGHTYIHFCDAT